MIKVIPRSKQDIDLTNELKNTAVSILNTTTATVETVESIAKGVGKTVALLSSTTDGMLIDQRADNAMAIKSHLDKLIKLGYSTQQAYDILGLDMVVDGVDSTTKQVEQKTI